MSRRAYVLHLGEVPYDEGVALQRSLAAAVSERALSDTVFLLHLGRLPEAGERDLLDAILVAVADHGSGAPSCAAARLAASGNRQSLSAAIAAGIRASAAERDT